MAKAKEEYPKILTELAAEITKMLTAKGIDEEEAFSVAFEITEHIRYNWGGEALYIPKGSISRRNADIVRNFKDKNFHQLGLKYGLTSRRVRMILKEAQQKKARRD